MIKTAAALGLLLLALFTSDRALLAQVGDAPSPSEGGSLASLEQANQAVLQALKNKDGKALASWVAPDRGLRFIPYPWDDISKAVVLGPKEIERIYQSKTKRVWGMGDASGDPIKMTGAQYLRHFVWNVDYSKITDREVLSLKDHLGKHYAYRINYEDVLETFPAAWAVTYFFPGVTGPQGGAMDWSWLTLVYAPQGTGWKLLGLVHKEWTI